MSRVAIYRRVSTTAQVDGFSLDTQLKQLTALAEERGFEWDDYCDAGISGEKLDERPEMMELLSRLDEYKAVLVEDESRLGRDELVFAIIRKNLREAGVRVITLSGETDLADPTGNMVSAILAAVVQGEQQMRTHKTKNGLKAAASAGYWTGGRPPFGYCLAPTQDGHTTLGIDQQEADLLSTIVGLIVDDGLSTFETCRRLEALGHRTRTGVVWNHRNLLLKLKRRHLLGEVPFETGGESIPRAFPPILSEERYEALQAALDRQPGTQDQHRTYPLSGRFHCDCGETRVGHFRNDRDLRYYLCRRNTSSANSSDPCSISPRYHRADVVDQLIWDAVQDTMSDPERLHKAAAAFLADYKEAAPRRTQQRSELATRLDEIDTERIRTFRDAKRLGLANHEIRQLLTELANERTIIETQLEELGDEPASPVLDDVTDRVRQLATLSKTDMANADLDAQKEILNLLNIQVIPSEDGYTIQGTLPYWPTECGKMPTASPQRH